MILFCQEGSGACQHPNFIILAEVMPTLSNICSMTCSALRRFLNNERCEVTHPLLEFLKKINSRKTEEFCMYLDYVIMQPAC